MPQNVREKGPLNLDLQAAVKKLYQDGKIKKDKEISEKTGLSRSLVSNYINGRAPMSPNFKESFETVYHIKLKDFESIDDAAKNEVAMPDINAIYRDRYIQALEEDKAYFKRLVESSLIDIVDRQKTLQAEIQAVHQWDAQQAAGKDKARAAANLHHIQKLVAGNRERNGKKSSRAEVGK